MTINEDVTGELTTPYEAIYSLSREFAEEQGKFPRPSIAAYLERVKTDYQPVLFRNLLGLEIESRRSGDDIPKIDEYISRFPSFEPIIREILMEAASISSSLSGAASQPLVATSPFPIASRLGSYRLVGELGRGGMGIVFEAIHSISGNRVALKTLPVLDGSTLHRFKREFRSLSGINHPNLIGLQQLEADGGQWFFTMDLIEGGSFIDYVRPDGILDEDRLRAALPQLVSGVMALHGLNIIHRDLKPSNVMVSHQGKVTILDFGLVVEIDSGASISMGTQFGAGTPRYMAPEQAGGLKVSAASDWYAVGVILYEALSGKAPFKGPMAKLLHEKQHRDAPPFEDPSLPKDLADLALRLLNRNPAKRPDAREIVKVIAAKASKLKSLPGSGQVLIGRGRHLARLEDTYDQFLKRDEPLTLFIKGRSGEGKTALSERFLNNIRVEKRAVIMAGRCYDRESVPFKALDTLIDALSNYLMSLSNEDAALVIPDDIGMLVRMFPVIQRIGMVAKVSDKRMLGLDETQLRQRAFRALRSLLARLARRRPIVWFVDDLQWGDADSAEALFEVLRPPEAPMLWLIGTYRSDETDDSPFLAKWTELQKRHDIHFSDHEVSVGPLTESECVELVIRQIGRDTNLIRSRAIEFARETHGNPFLLTELAGCFDPESDAFEAIPLHEVLSRKLERLPGEASDLLEVVAISGQALSLYEGARTAGHESIPMATITRMRNERLIRLIGSEEHPMVDTYHDRVRETVIDQMNPERNRYWHRKLGEQIEKETGLDSGVLFTEIHSEKSMAVRATISRVFDLAYHFNSAGIRQKAMIYGLAGAQQAQMQSALEVAVNNFEIAQANLGNEDKETQFKIIEGLGVALTRLGRYEEGISVASNTIDLFNEPEKKVKIELILGEIAFKQGKMLKGVNYYESGLKRLGFWLPRSSFGLGYAFFKEAFIQTLHSIFPKKLYKLVPSRKEELIIELMHRLCQPYAFMGTPRTLWSHICTLNKCENYPPTSHLIVTNSFHGAIITMIGWSSRSSFYCSQASRFARELNDQWTIGVANSYKGISEFFKAEYEAGLITLTESIFAFEKAGDIWEANLARFHRACCYLGLGDLKSAVVEAQNTLQLSTRLGDSRVFCSSYLWARASKGNFPFQEIRICFPDRQDDTMSFSHGIMAEGHWHAFHGRTAESLEAFERAYALISKRMCWNAHMILILPELAGALRRHADFLFKQDPSQAWKLRKRAYKLAKWSKRIMWFFPASRPMALREWALNLEVYGKTQKAWEAATLSTSLALAQKARYEHAQSLLLCGQLGKKLGHPQADEQIRLGRSAMEELEKPLKDLTSPGMQKVGSPGSTPKRVT